MLCKSGAAPRGKLRDSMQACRVYLLFLEGGNFGFGRRLECCLLAEDGTFGVYGIRRLRPRSEKITTVPKLQKITQRETSMKVRLWHVECTKGANARGGGPGLPAGATRNNRRLTLPRREPTVALV
jgi:hypothetical protein